MKPLPAQLRCPHCGEKGTRVEDVVDLKGLLMNFPYCGFCGKNWPQPKPQQEKAS